LIFRLLLLRISVKLIIINRNLGIESHRLLLRCPILKATTFVQVRATSERMVGEVDCARVTLKVVVAALSVLRRRWRRAGGVALLSLLHKFVLFLGFGHWGCHWRLRLGFLRLLLLSLHHHLVLVHLVVIGLLLAIPEHRLEIMLLHVTHHFNMLRTQCIIILANVAPVLATVRVIATRVTRVGALPFLFLVLLLIFLVLFLLFLLLQVSLRLFWWF